MMALDDERRSESEASADTATELPGRELERWIESVSGRQPLAVVLGGQANGLCFARSIGRRHVPTLMLAGSHTHTRYAKTILLPDAVAHPQVWLEVLDRIAAS